jgi:hypothetical protein
MTITGVLSFNDSIYDQTDGIVVAAFIEDTICVGKVASRFYSKVGKYRVPLMIYGNENGISVVLKAYLPDEDSIFIMTDAYEFMNDESYGNYGEPIVWTIDDETALRQVEEVSFLMYPNPASEQVSLEGIGESLVEVYDYSGKKVQVPMFNGADKCLLNTASLKVGFYLISVSDGHSRQTQKLVVK